MGIDLLSAIAHGAVIASTLNSYQANPAVYCSGKVLEAYTGSDGEIMIRSSWRGDWTMVCNLRTAWKAIDPQVCWAWFAQVNTAVAEQTTIGIYYLNLQGSGVCQALPTYGNAPAPRYVRLSSQ